MFDLSLTKHLAELSKIAFTDDELAQMTEDMTDIIALMDKVCDFDTSKETYALNPTNYNDLRPDEPTPSVETEKILENSKIIKNNSFVVPKVV